MTILDNVEPRVLSRSELGQMVRYLREIRQWTQETLAELAKTTPRTIQRVESGAGASLNSLRSLASAFELNDIDAFTRPMAIPTEEQLQTAREQFERRYVLTRALKLRSARDLARLAAESIGDYIEPGFEPSRDQALAFAELTDYLRDYRECADQYSSTARLEVFEDLQALINGLTEQGVTLRYATCSVIQHKTPDAEQEPRPIGNVLYLIGFREDEAPEELALPRKMGT